MTYCCDVMRQHAEHSCGVHGADCPDQVVSRTRKGYYVLPIYDGGGSGVEISYCPWCGSKVGSEVEDGIAAIEDLLEEEAGGKEPRRVTFGRLTLGGNTMPEDVALGGSWILAEHQGRRLNTMIVVDGVEARRLMNQMNEKLQ